MMKQRGGHDVLLVWGAMRSDIITAHRGESQTGARINAYFSYPRRHMNTDATHDPLREIGREISRDDLLALPVRRYEGEVCLVETAQHLERALADLRDEQVIGFDTETRPAFTKGESYPPALVQAATARTVYIFQLRRREVFPVVAEMLEASHMVKAGVALGRDLSDLKAVLPFAERNVLDLGVLARRSGMKQTGVRNLAGMLLGFRIPKGNTTSNWAAPQLTPAQIAYAATDAWACRELYLRFQALGLLNASA
jgi:3'-5' exonuclease